MIATVKHYILLLFAGSLMMSTPLSIGMNTQESTYKKIDECRQAFFYLKQSYSENKDRALKKENADSLANFILMDSKNHNDAIHKDIVFSLFSKIPLDIRRIHLSKYYILASLKLRTSTWQIFHALNDYYCFLASKDNLTQKNRSQFIDNYKAVAIDKKELVLTKSLKKEFETLLSKKKISRKTLLFLADCFGGGNLSSLITWSLFYANLFFMAAPIIPTTALPTIDDNWFCYAKRNFEFNINSFVMQILATIIFFAAVTYHETKSENFNQLKSSLELLQQPILVNIDDETLNRYKTYFDHLYYKAQKHQETGEISLKKILEKEDEFLFK